MSVIKPVDFINQNVRKNSSSFRSAFVGFLMGAFVMGCISYFLFLKYEVAPRVPALMKAWNNHQEVESLEISTEFIVKK